jgi:sulfoxide reductase catalytic subunit YedY
MHHSIQGWSGIAQWRGVSMKKLVDLVKPKRAAKTVVFFSFGEGLYGGVYYNTQSLENVREPECLLVSEMNGAPLPREYGRSSSVPRREPTWDTKCSSGLNE